MKQQLIQQIIFIISNKVYRYQYKYMTIALIIELGDWLSSCKLKN